MWWKYYNVLSLPDLICCMLGYHDYFINALHSSSLVYCCEHCSKHKTVWLWAELPDRWIR